MSKRRRNMKKRCRGLNSFRNSLNADRGLFQDGAFGQPTKFSKRARNRRPKHGETRWNASPETRILRRASRGNQTTSLPLPYKANGETEREKGNFHFDFFVSWFTDVVVIAVTLPSNSFLSFYFRKLGKNTRIIDRLFENVSLISSIIIIVIFDISIFVLSPSQSPSQLYLLQNINECPCNLDRRFNHTPCCCRALGRVPINKFPG